MRFSITLLSLSLLVFCAFFYSAHASTQSSDTLDNEIIVFSQDSTNQSTLIIRSSEATENEPGVGVVIKRNDGKDFYKDDFNLYGIIALIVAFASIIVASFTFVAQLKTERHTRNVPLEDQLKRFESIYRHVYDSYAKLFSIRLSYFNKENGSNKKRNEYPSELEMRSMMIDPSGIVLSINAKYKLRITQLYDSISLTNKYIEEASRHFSNRSIEDKVKEQDLAAIINEFSNLMLYLLTLELDIENKHMILNEIAYKVHTQWLTRHITNIEQVLSQEQITKALSTYDCNSYEMLYGDFFIHESDNESMFSTLIWALSYPDLDVDLSSYKSTLKESVLRLQSLVKVPVIDEYCSLIQNPTAPVQLFFKTAICFDALMKSLVMLKVNYE